MILAVSASGGAEILVHRVVGTRDLAGIRSVVGTYEAMARFVPVLFFTGPLDGKRYVDVSENSFYWYFVVGAWLPIYFIIYWGARVAP